MTVGFGNLPTNHVPIGAGGQFGTKNIGEFKNMELLWSGSYSFTYNAPTLTYLGLTQAQINEYAYLIFGTDQGTILVCVNPDGSFEGGTVSTNFQASSTNTRFYMPSISHTATGTSIQLMGTGMYVAETPTISLEHRTYILYRIHGLKV